MFGKDQEELLDTLSTMRDEALRKSCFNHAEANRELRGMIQTDRRFDGYDPERLVSQVEDCAKHCKRLDLDDPVLKRGGEPRPKTRRGLW
jgi:hypothetical protein